MLTFERLGDDEESFEHGHFFLFKKKLKLASILLDRYTTLYKP